MVVAMACTENWYHYSAVNIYSLLKTTKEVQKIYLLLETDNINDIPELKKVVEKYPVELKIINFNNIFDSLVEKRNVNRNTIFSNFTFARLALPSIVEENKILYIDTDAIVLKNIYNMWRIDIEKYYLAGCKDIRAFDYGVKKRINIEEKYVNAGIIIMNLKKMREDNIQKKCFNIINEKKLLFPDQDALNIVCQDKILYIPSMYNFAPGTTSNVICREQIRIIHYTDYKKYWLVDKPYSELWYDVEEKFYDEFGI